MSWMQFRRLVWLKDRAKTEKVALAHHFFENHYLDYMHAAPDSPPHFHWEDWYLGVGGRHSPLSETDEILDRIYNGQYPRFDGPVASEKQYLECPERAANVLKAKAKEYGADIVGICEIEPGDIYKGRLMEEKYAIAVGKRMRYSAFKEVPSKESAIECIRIYEELGETVIKLADYIRSLGWPCKIEHPIGDSDLLHIPIGLKAGFGELGRHGSIIHPDLGPLFRMGSVATSLPMALDAPIDAGIAEFCDNCNACRIYCPANAIPDRRSPEAGKDHLGKDRYLVDTGKCFPYFNRNYYCSICLPVCIYNRKEWAKDFPSAKPDKFPDVDMQPAPPPFDGVPTEIRHDYPKVNRNPAQEVFADRFRKK